MTAFSQVYDLKNLRRAYRWVGSNPDARYKAYFRQAYAAYALASERNLRALRRQMRTERFNASHASKIYEPKSSGLLRPMSLLTVNDQIAYQACVNVVAEALYPSTKKRYNVSVFQHTYAGKSSPFFYHQWQRSYRSYGNAIRRNFSNGYVYIATFDLTAFYDSIDHGVLRHFLVRTGVDPDTSDFLLRCLRQWSSSTWSSHPRSAIYHGHGIPQGPLASGLLSEVVLQHIDQVGERRGRNVKYLRYVDDIRIMAKDENTLRRRLVSLDLAAKEVGLFPQTSKIDIRLITDPEDEIKSVSRPPEPAASPFASQSQVQRPIKELIGRRKVLDATRFKFALPHLVPSHKTNSILVRALVAHPDLADAITRHFSSYTKLLPRKLVEQLLPLAVADGVYHSVNAGILDLLFDRVDAPTTQTLADFAYERLFAGRYKTSAHPFPQSSYHAALSRWAMKSSRLTYIDLTSMISGQRDWWVQGQLIADIDADRWGPPSFQALMNAALRLEQPEPARIAAMIAFDKGISPLKPHRQIQWSAQLSLISTGMIARLGSRPSLVAPVLSYVLRRPITAIDWRAVLGPGHESCEHMAILTKQRFETDIDAFLVSLDSLCDALVRSVYERRGFSMTAAYGNVLKAGAPTWLKTTFPKTLAAFGRLHDLRIRSFTAHPRDQKTGLPNRRLKHASYYRLRRAMIEAFDELESNI